MGSWGEEKERPAKNNLAAHSREREDKSRVAVLVWGANRRTRQASVENPCAGPVRLIGAIGLDDDDTVFNKAMV